jgi:hypothetical protein
MVKRIPALLLFAVLIISPAPASAAIIGVFGWDYDALYPDSRFSVWNDSLDDFENVVIEIFAPDDTSLGTESLGTISPSATQNTIDFYPFFVPSDLDRARLTFLYLSTPVTLDLLASGLDGDPNSLLGGGAPITFETQAPEPTSMVLLLTGMGGLWLRRRRRVSGEPPCNSQTTETR